MCVCVRERERGLQLHFGSGCLSPLIGFFYQRRHSKACELKSTVFPSSFTLRVLTISHFDSYIYLYIYIVIHVDIVHLTQFLKFLPVKQHWYWYWYWYSTYLILLSLDFTSHFERFTKDIFTLLSWTANLYGSYNIHHYYYYY